MVAKDDTPRLNVLRRLGGMEFGREQHFAVAQCRLVEPEERAGRSLTRTPIPRIAGNKHVCVSYKGAEIDLGLGVKLLRSDGDNQVDADNGPVEVHHGPGNLCFDGQTVTFRE